MKYLIYYRKIIRQADPPITGGLLVPQQCFREVLCSFLSRVNFAQLIISEGGIISNIKCSWMSHCLGVFLSCLRFGYIFRLEFIGNPWAYRYFLSTSSLTFFWIFSTREILVAIIERRICINLKYIPLAHQSRK